MRALWRVVAGAVVGVVLLPIVINFATEQPLPSWLEPYRTWSWPVVTVLGSLAVALGATAVRSRPPGRPRRARSGRAPGNARWRTSTRT